MSNSISADKKKPFEELKAFRFVFHFSPHVHEQDNRQLLTLDQFPAVARYKMDESDCYISG